MDKQDLFKYKLTDDDDVFFIDGKEIEKTCISISEIEKMTEEQKENNTKSIIMDGATWVAVADFGETVISGDDENKYFVKSVMNAKSYIKKPNIIDFEQEEFYTDMITVKKKNKKESRKNHFYDKKGKRLNLKEDLEMANNINLSGDDLNVDLSGFDDKDFDQMATDFGKEGFDLPENTVISGEFDKITGQEGVSGLTSESLGYELSEDAEFVVTHSAVLAYLTPKDAESTIRFKKSIKTMRDPDTGASYIVLNDKATQLDKEFQAYQKNKAVDANAKAPQIRDKNDKLVTMKVQNVTAEAKEYVHNIVGAQVKPSVSHYIVQMPKQLANIGMEDFARIQDGTFNLDRTETATTIKVLNAQNFKIFLLAIGGNINEFKSEIIPNPGSLSINEGTRQKDGKEIKTYSITFNKLTIQAAKRMKQGEAIAVQTRKSLLTPENYLPLKVAETVVLSDTMSDEDHAKAKETVANLFAKYSQQSAGPAKLASLSDEASALLAKDDKGRFYFPLLENKQDIPKLLDKLGGKNWYNGEPITKFDLGTVVTKEKEGGAISYVRVWNQTAPAKRTPEKDAKSALNMPKFKAIVNFLPTVMNYDQIRFATTRTSSGTAERTRKSAESIFSKMQRASSASLSNSLDEAFNNVKRVTEGKSPILGMMFNRDTLKKNEDMLKKSFDPKSI